MSRDTAERLRSLLRALEDPDAVALADDDSTPVLALARRHRLGSLLAASGTRLDAATLAQLRQDRLMVTAHVMMLEQAAGECVAALSAAGIDTIVLKGLAYQRTVYDKPGLRPTSDVDVLVPMEARRTAFAVLDRLGFEPRAAAPGFDDSDYHEVAWRRGRVEIDLHMALAPLVRCAVDYREVWTSARPLDLNGVRALALAPAHAAVFHALHMAIDHFQVPAIYLVDFARLVPDAQAASEAETTARRWRCHRPFETTMALSASLLPRWGSKQVVRAPSRLVRAIISGYGESERLSRPWQLVRKVAHFDRASDLARYLFVQGRRNIREVIEVRRGRSARERLRLPARA